LVFAEPPNGFSLSHQNYLLLNIIEPNTLYYILIILYESTEILLPIML